VIVAALCSLRLSQARVVAVRRRALQPVRLCRATLCGSARPARARLGICSRYALCEAKQHKLKRLVQSPNSFFMDVKCPGCFQITTVFSHASTVVFCGACSTVLCQPTGGKARLTEGCSFRRKVE